MLFNNVKYIIFNFRKHFYRAIYRAILVTR